MFEDKPFVEEDQAFAGSLFQDVPPFLLSQILSLPMKQWVAIEASDPKNEEKQRRNVLNEWGKADSTANWSVLVETLIELGLRGRAQSACIEKGQLYSLWIYIFLMFWVYIYKETFCRILSCCYILYGHNVVVPCSCYKNGEACRPYKISYQCAF